jgi:hypothetical protein
MKKVFSKGQHWCIFLLLLCINFNTAHAQTDAGTIIEDIGIVFGKWNQKGEFEKAAAYDERLKTQSQDVFTRICMDQIKRYIYHQKYTMERGCRNTDIEWCREGVHKKLLRYDTESESFPILFTIVKDHRKVIEWKSKVNIPIADAPKFKENWSKLEVELNADDWNIIGNIFCPTRVTLVNKTDGSKYEFTVPLENSTNITCAFDKLNIPNPYLTELVFRYSTERANERKKAAERKVQAESQTPRYAASNKVWVIDNDSLDIHQIWSDHINVPACNKETYDGGSYKEAKPDCWHSPKSDYYAYSWPYVNENADTLCPSPWRVPTCKDANDLYVKNYKAGGDGNSLMDAARSSGFSHVTYYWINCDEGSVGESTRGCLLPHARWHPQMTERCVTIKSDGRPVEGRCPPPGRLLMYYSLFLRCVWGA